MNKKNSKHLIIMLSLVVALAAVFIVVKLTSDKEKVVTEDISYPITSLTEEQLSKVVYDYKDGSHAAYAIKAGKWYNADDSEFPLSSDAFKNQFVKEFVNIKALKKLDSFEGGLEALGLSEPEIDITITSLSGSSVNYKMGNYNPTMDLYYLMINNDEDEIYMVDKTLAYICRSDIYDYALVDSFPKYSVDSLKYIEFVSGSSYSKLSYSKEEREEDITGYQWHWFFEEPFSRAIPCDGSKIDITMKEDLFDNLSYLKTVNYKATEEEMAKYGLDNPRGSYGIYSIVKDENGGETDKSVVVYIGNPTEDNSGYYTREVTTSGLSVEKSSVVRIMNASAADEVMGVNPLDYVVPNLMFLSLEDINGSYIVFNNGEREFKFGYNDSGTDVKTDDIYTYNDSVIEGNAFQNLWYQMVSMKPDRIIANSADIKEGEPVYTIFSKRIKDDYYGPITVKFIKYDSSYYQVEVNGIADILMRKKDVDALFSELTDYVENTLEKT